MGNSVYPYFELRSQTLGPRMSTNWRVCPEPPPRWSRGGILSRRGRTGQHSPGPRLSPSIYRTLERNVRRHPHVVESFRKVPSDIPLCQLRCIQLHDAARSGDSTQRLPSTVGAIQVAFAFTVYELSTMARGQPSKARSWPKQLGEQSVASQALL